MTERESSDQMTERASSANMGLLQVKYAEDAGRLTRFALARFYAALGRLLDQVEADSVLDAGCGEGHILARFLAGRYSQVCGLDLDMQRLQYARDHQACRMIWQANLHTLPLPSNAVDLVIALEVLEHVGHPERALSELHRVTRRYAILSVPNEPFWRAANMLRGAYWRQLGNTPEHINHWSVWGFQRFVGTYFRVLDVATPVTWSFVLVEKR